MMVSPLTSDGKRVELEDLLLDRPGVQAVCVLYLYVRGDPGAPGLAGGDPTLKDPSSPCTSSLGARFPWALPCVQKG